ncbi:unnamed protein product [Caretta caretta]
MVGAEIVKLCILKMPPTPEKYRARLLILGLALAEKEKSYPEGPTEDSIVACVAGLGNNLISFQYNLPPREHEQKLTGRR